jgi:hypothetical protein
MGGRNLLLAAIGVCPTVAIADVEATTLVPLATDLVSAEMRTYSHEGQTHSILIEAQTGYGDDLPYLFNCTHPAVQCRMEFAQDEYRYLLDIRDGVVTIVTQGTTDDFTNIDTFRIAEPQ